MLNNKGWGIRSYIIGCSILLMALIVATFYIMRLYSTIPGMGDVVDSVDYKDLESRMDRASLNYINQYYKQDIRTGVVVVSTEKMLDKYLIDELDLVIKGDKCKGYSLIRKNLQEDKLESESFIKCKYYESPNYQSWRIE